MFFTPKSLLFFINLLWFYFNENFGLYKNYFNNDNKDYNNNNDDGRDDDDVLVDVFDDENYMTRQQTSSQLFH